MKMLCEYFRMYHYISLGKAGKIHRYHWKSGGKTVEKHTGAFSDGMWLCKIEAQGRIGPLRRRMQGRASLVRVCEANNCPQGNHAACRSGFASGKLHSFRMPDKQCLSLRQRMTVFGFFGGVCCRSVRARGYAPLQGAASAGVWPPYGSCCRIPIALSERPLIRHPASVRRRMPPSPYCLLPIA